MANNPWGYSTYGSGEFGTGLQNAVGSVTGQSLTTALNSVTVTAEINRGWGRLTWGSLPWGGEITNVTTVLVSDESNRLVTTLESVTVTANSTTALTSLQLTTNLNSVTATGTGSTLLTGEQLTSLYPGFQTSTVQNVSGTSDDILFTFRPGASSKVQYVGPGWNVVGQPTFIVTAVSLDPNDQYTGTITITGGTFVSGQSYAFESPNVNIIGTGNLTLDSQDLQTQLGYVDPGPDAVVFGEQMDSFIGDVSTTITIDAYPTGEQLTTTLDSVFIVTEVDVPLTGEQLTLTEDSVTISAEANTSVSGELLTLKLLPDITTSLHDSMTTYDTSAYVNGDSLVYLEFLDAGVIKVDSGVHIEYMSYTSKEPYPFDVNVFILNGLTRGLYGTTPETHAKDSIVVSQSSAIQTSGTANIPLTGEQLTLTLDSVFAKISVNALVTGQSLTLSEDSVSVTANANIDISGQQLTLEEGTVDPNPDANVTGQQLTLTLDSVIARISVNAPVTGQTLTLAQGSVSATANANANLTGVNLTGYTGQLYSTAWAAVDTGASSVWTPVNTAA
jgi:hypothetical protein